MFERFKRHLSPLPISAQDDVYPARLLRVILPLFLGFAMFYVTLAPLLYDTPRLIWMVAGMVVPLWLAAYYATRKQLWKPASLLFLAGLWFSVTWIFVARGVLSANLAGMYLIIIFTAGLFLGPAAAWGFAGLCLLSYVGVSAAVHRGILTPSVSEPSLWAEALGWILDLVCALAILHLIRRAFAETLRQAREHEVARSASEQKYRRVVENANEGIVIIQDDRICYLNPKCLSLLGQTLEEVAQTPFTEFVYPEDRPAAQARHQQRLAGVALPDTYTLRLISEADVVRWVEVRAVLLEWEGRTATLNFLSDITERKHADAALQQQHRDLILLNRVISAAATTLNPVEVLRVLCHELAQAFDLPQAAATLIAPGESTAPVVAEYRVAGRPSAVGIAFPLDQAATAHILRTQEPLFIPNAQTDPLMESAWEDMRYRGTVSLLLVPVVVRGRVISTLGLDALEERVFSEADLALIQNAASAAGQTLEAANLHQELQRHAENLEAIVARRTLEVWEALEQVRAANESKSRFLSNVSHELRTPLTSIRLYLSLLDVGADERQGRYIESLNRESLRLQTLIEGLLMLSRLDLGKIRPEIASVDLNGLLQTLASDRQQLFAQHGLVLYTELDPQLPLIHADIKLLEQVATNLLTNALNYTPAGGEVRLCTGVHPNERPGIIFCVSDTGPGISAEDRRHLFERFYRGEAGRVSQTSGTGLGLSICKEIVDLHRGRITFESPPTGGTTFTVWLPGE